MIELYTQSTFCSLDIKITEWSGEISEELGDTDGIDFSLVVDIIVIPCLVISVFEIEPSITISSTLSEVSANNFLSGTSCASFSQVEFSSWLWVLQFWISDSLNSVVCEHILGEFVNWIISIISSISNKDLSEWHDSVVWIHIVSEFVNSSWEFVHMWMPSVPIWKTL